MKKELIDEAVRLVEETHNDDIGTADFSFNKLIKTFEELPTVSLLREVATTVPMKMSTGNIINIRRNASTNSFETVEATLTINTASSNPIQSGLSVEAMTDLNNQYGLDGYKIAANLLKGIVDQTENDAFIVFLDANALNTTA